MKTISIALIAGVVGCTLGQPVSAAEPAKFQEKVLWSFGSGTDGKSPSASMIDVKGTVYGVTGGGGDYGGGTVFTLDPNTDSETVLYSFCSQTRCTDGKSPGASLIDVKENLYGTTVSGGSSTSCGEGCGTLFSFNPNTGAQTVLHSFGTYPDGQNPQADLIDVNGTLYGTTYAGGSYGYGTVFSLDRKTGTERTLYTFCSQYPCTDGDLPIGGLIDVNGTLYGTTFGGGTSNECVDLPGCGTVFSLDLGTGAEKVLYSFCSQPNCADGVSASGSLIALNGTLYGLTLAGGIGCHGNGCGTLFSLDPASGAETTLYSFCSRRNCTDGAQPEGSLVAVNGKLYGTTFYGGSTGCGGYGCGVAFSLNPSTGAEKVLYSFCAQQNCTDGEGPNAGLIDSKGTLYGTTEAGGTYGYGTVFALAKQ